VLVAGDNQVTESVPELYTLTIRTQDAEKAPDIDLMGQAFDLDLQFRKGVCVVKFLPAGSYRLVTYTGEMQVDVPGTQEVVFAPRAYDCLRLTIRPEGGKVEGLGLRNNDKLIEVDGVEIRPEDGYIQVQGSLTRTSTRWIVLRDGVRTEVTFDGTALYAILTTKDESREGFQFDRALRD
jgi:hypothetical protein